MSPWLTPMRARSAGWGPRRVSFYFLIYKYSLYFTCEIKEIAGRRGCLALLASI